MQSHYTIAPFSSVMYFSLGGFLATLGHFHWKPNSAPSIKLDISLCLERKPRIAVKQATHKLPDCEATCFVNLY